MYTIINTLEAALQKNIILLSFFSEEELNTIPFAGSWTAAQVGEHLRKSGNAMDAVFLSEGKAANRPADEKAPELKAVFLDFENKMQAPEIVVPEEKQYHKEQLISALNTIIDKVVQAVKNTDLTTIPALPEGNPFQGHTKLELLHFMAYHTQRHNHQLEEISSKVITP